MQALKPLDSSNGSALVFTQLFAIPAADIASFPLPQTIVDFHRIAGDIDTGAVNWAVIKPHDNDTVVLSSEPLKLPIGPVYEHSLRITIPGIDQDKLSRLQQYTNRKLVIIGSCTDGTVRIIGTPQFPVRLHFTAGNQNIDSGPGADIAISCQSPHLPYIYTGTFDIATAPGYLITS